MHLSIFDVIGPVMVGPSSSHTAGAAKLARVARMIAAGPFSHVAFGLHGSFARTYKGHGTDRALVAGALGLMEDDERLSEAFTLAEEQGLAYEFYEASLDNVHENSVVMTFHMENGAIREIVGSSIGGAQILIRRIDGFEVEFPALCPTLVIRQRDRKGTVSVVTHVLAESGINIGVMRLSRTARGDVACCVIETDSLIPDAVVTTIRGLPNILEAQAINIEPAAL